MNLSDEELTIKADEGHTLGSARLAETSNRSNNTRHAHSSIMPRLPGHSAQT